MTVDVEAQVQVSLFPDEVERLWCAEGLALTKLQASLLPDLRRRLGRMKANPMADYLVGKAVETFSPNITQELTAHLLDRFRPQETGVAAVSLLAKVIDRGNAKGIFSLCPPPVPVLVKRQSSPFRDDRWPTLGVATRLRSLLASSIRAPKAVASKPEAKVAAARIAIGQMLVSAIVHGGLLAPSSLEALLRHLAVDEVPLKSLGGRIFMELSLGYKKQAGAEFRRWYPDPLTTMLIMNLFDESWVPVKDGRGADTNRKEIAGRIIWSSITTFLRAAGADRFMPRTLRTVLDAVRLDLESRIPIYLVHYAARTFVSHSLKPASYRRLHGIPVPAQSASDDAASKRADADSNRVIKTDTESCGDIEPRWLALMRAAMKGSERKEIIQSIEELVSRPAPGFMSGEVGELFAGFALRLFSVNSNGKDKMAVSTARAVVASVSVRLGGLAGNDIYGFGSEEWAGLYEEALSDAETPGIRRKLTRALRDFQRYREIERGADSMVGAEIFSTADGLVPVDANVISEVEFLKIRERFAADAADELPGLAGTREAGNLASIAALVLTLSYRCGLRRMEVLKLELDDLLLGDSWPELLVRPTESRRLKTKSSTRKLPLAALLAPSEIEDLSKWAQHRRNSETLSPSYSQFLFALPTRGFLCVPQDTLFDLLHRVMRKVTGDQTLRFHHLRHSFASQAFIRLAASARGSAPALQVTLPGYEALLQSANAFREKLFGRTGMTRKDLWAVCSLLGHSGPDVSVEHYIHHLDIVLAEALASDGIAPGTDVIIAASRASVTQAYRHRKDERLDAWAAHLLGKRFKESMPGTKEKNQTRKSTRSDAKTEKMDDAGVSLERIWRFVLIQQTTQRSIEEISGRHGIAVERLQRYVDSAIWLAGLKASSAKTNYRHRFTEWAPDRRRPDQKRRIACPVKPHEARDRVVVRDLANRFREAYKRDKALVRKVVWTFATGARDDFAGMIFADPGEPESAREFLECLRLFGYRMSDIRFISFDVTSKRSAQAAAWRAALGLHSSIAIDKVAPKNGRRDWACPWLGVQLEFEDNKGVRMASAGFRFVMIMAAIAMGIREEDRLPPDQMPSA